MNGSFAPVRPDQLRHVVDLARHAPSVHNTQPWRFVPTPFGLELHSDGARRLTRLDPLGRQLTMSCGAALHHAEVAARALGLAVAVEPLADGGTHLANIVINEGMTPDDDELRLAAALLQRHTHRGRFDARPVPTRLLRALQSAAEARGSVLAEVTAEHGLLDLTVLLSRAARVQEADPQYQSELRCWVHEDPLRGDGILAASPWAAAGSSLRQRDFALGSAAAESGAAPVPDRPLVLVLATDDDSPLAWLRAGQALSEVLVRAATQGVQGQPLGHVTDDAACRARLRGALSLVTHPQLVLRLGYAPHRAPSRRRGVDQVLAAVAH